MAEPAPAAAASKAARRTTPPDASPRRRRVDAQRNRTAILKAAEIVFRTQGADAPIDEIARRAGVGVGTVYRNYPTKAAVLEAIIEARLTPIIEAARSACRADDAGAAFFALLRRLAEESAAFKALADAIAAAGIDLSATKKELSNQLVTAMHELFARAQRSGQVRHDVSIDDVTMLMGGLSHTAFPASDKPARTRCVNLVCDALRGDSATARPRGTRPRAR
jgi:AcrR family transcriptional regulator